MYFQRLKKLKEKKSVKNQLCETTCKVTCIGELRAKRFFEKDVLLPSNIVLNNRKTQGKRNTLVARNAWHVLFIRNLENLQVLLACQFYVRMF